jgi:hypothetical protein
MGLEQIVGAALMLLFLADIVTDRALRTGW